MKINTLHDNWTPEEMKALCEAFISSGGDKTTTVHVFSAQNPTNTRSFRAVLRKVERYICSKPCPSTFCLAQTGRKVPGVTATITGIAKPKISMIVQPTASTSTTGLFDTLTTLQKPYASKFTEVNNTTEIESALKILTLSDIHFPFARLDILEEAIQDNLDADVLVLNGDIIEAYGFSTYTKSRVVSALAEYQCAFNLVKRMSEIFPKVYLTDGNHEARVSRALREAGFGGDIMKYYGPSMLGRIAAGEELDNNGKIIKKHDFKNVFYDYHNSWYCKIGKTIFAHPHARGSANPVGTVKKAADYFLSLYRDTDIDCVVIGHTHKQSKSCYAHALLIEQGCFAAPAPYAHSPELTYFGGSQNGYAVVHQSATGECIRNKSGFYTFGTALPYKKE